jgi:pimeloyl-ACP methyl ester carboxylesterase
VSGDLEIRGGGVIAVDTETLRMTAGRFVTAAAALEDIAHRLGSLQNMLLGQRDVAAGAVSAATVLSTRMSESMSDAAMIAASLRETAAVYELVELNAQHAAAVFGGDGASATRIERLRAELMREFPGAMAAARGLEFERAIMWPSDLVRSATETGMDAGGVLEILDKVGPWGRMLADVGGVVGGAAAGLGAIAAATVVGAGGWGRLSNSATLAPGRDDVVVRPVAPMSTGSAPSGLASAAGRMPGAGESRVRVEKYVSRDGSAQYAVYVSGTRSGDVGGREAWDMASNSDLVLGCESASYQATIAALEDAGARPGDTVHAFGHSQGAMITAHLALDGPFDVRTLVSLGSPVEADVGDATLAVSIRHTDDAVAALAGGGHGAGVGAPGSIVVERSTSDPADVGGGPGPHSLESYVETAGLVDGSTDPRVDAVRAVLADLRDATRVEVTEYGAERVPGVSLSPSAGAGSRTPS